MKKFVKPTVEVIEFTNQDIIVTSGFFEDMDNFRIRVQDILNMSGSEEDTFV